MMLRKKLFHFTGVSLLVNVCPGKKDYVSVKTDGVKEYAQKCLLLGNFKELYVNFYKENSDVRKEGFSTSCTLRPKECITVNNCGSHNVCVCPHHQNTKLMVPAVNKPLCYKDLTTLLACDTANEDCMLK